MNGRYNDVGGPQGLGACPFVLDHRDRQRRRVQHQPVIAAIADAQAAYNALGDDGSAETGKAKEFLDKAKEFRNDNEPEAAWAAAIKAKSYCALSKLLQQTRAAGLK